MESTSPYRTPTSDVRPPVEGGSDPTPPYSPAGRFGRLSYLAWTTVTSIVGQLIMLVVGGGAAFGLSGASGETAMQGVGMAAMAVYLVVGLATLVLTLVFSIRRCHDIDISGWWNLLILIPIANLVYWLFLILKSGTDGPNRFGPARPTPGWEKVVGIIGIVLFVGAFLFGIIAAVALPAYLDFIGQAGQAGM